MGDGPEDAAAPLGVSCFGPTGVLGLTPSPTALALGFLHFLQWGIPNSLAYELGLDMWVPQCVHVHAVPEGGAFGGELDLIEATRFSIVRFNLFC